MAATHPRTASGRDLLDALGPGVAPAAPHGDITVAARLVGLVHTPLPH